MDGRCTPVAREEAGVSIDQITQARLIPDAFRNELSESDDDTEVWLVLVEKIKALRVADPLGSEQRNLSCLLYTSPSPRD